MLNDTKSAFDSEFENSGDESGSASTVEGSYGCTTVEGSYGCTTVEGSYGCTTAN